MSFSLNEFVLGGGRCLFILSHMRSRSTVLSHVLGSNSGICGYSELHLSYKNIVDLIKMRLRLYMNSSCPVSDRDRLYFLDKILSKEHEISPQFVEKVRPRFIFLVRQPEETIKSIINMGYITAIEWYKDPANACSHYCGRLEYIMSFAGDNCHSTKDDFFFIESGDIVNDTANLLRDLSSWLCLPEPLDSRYSKFRNTGKPKHGDPSENINSGVISRTPEHRDIEIPDDILRDANSAYERVLSFFENLNKVKIQ